MILWSDRMLSSRVAYRSDRYVHSSASQHKNDIYYYKHIRPVSVHDLRQPITSTESVLQAHWLTDADEINKLRVHIVLFAEKRWPCAQEC